jgi:hypothetical protein
MKSVSVCSKILYAIKGEKEILPPTVACVTNHGGTQLFGEIHVRMSCYLSPRADDDSFY